MCFTGCLQQRLKGATMIATGERKRGMTNENMIQQ